MKFCIGHKSNYGVLWKNIFDDKSHQVCSMEAEVLDITMVILEIVSMYIFIYGLLFANFVIIFVAQVL